MMGLIIHPSPFGTLRGSPRPRATTLCELKIHKVYDVVLGRSESDPARIRPTGSGDYKGSRPLAIEETGARIPFEPRSAVTVQTATEKEKRRCIVRRFE